MEDESLTGGDNDLIIGFREEGTHRRPKRRSRQQRPTVNDTGLDDATDNNDGDPSSWGTSQRTHTDREIDNAIIERLRSGPSSAQHSSGRIESVVMRLDSVDRQLREQDADDAGDFSVRYCTTAFCSLFLGSTGFGTMWFTVAEKFLAPDWTSARKFGVAIQSMYAVIGGAALVLYLVRIAVRPRHFWTVELREARQSALLSSGAMGLALVPQAIHNTWPLAPIPLLSTVYYAGFALHVALHILFLACRYAQRRVESLEDVTPGWYVVGVGTAAYAAAASPDFARREAMYVALGIGVASLVWQLPLITYRLWKRPLPVDWLPSVCVYMAPCALCTAAWFAAVPHDAPCFLPVQSSLCGMAVCCTVVVLTYYRRMFLWAPPRPNWAAYTFPTVIFAVALVYTSLAVKAKYPDQHALNTALRTAAWIAIANTTVVVNVVIIFGFIVGGRMLGVLYMGVDRYDVRSSANL